ncbi:unnamed protein product [Chilo suppressalis]|uniref:Sulfatase N-terminal domain-containing protein n=1 Tax=Chilo suppressalis TaxID=168631 RepID=A0ABN8B909_CHISP|nr:unnamed protein product [Chilo suppressalis]
MTITMKRWYRSRRNQFIIVILIISCTVYYALMADSLPMEQDLDLTRSVPIAITHRIVAASSPPVVEATNLKRAAIIEYIEKRLQETLKTDKGTGCEIPQLDPFSKEVMQFNKDLPPIKCKGQDWVKCWHSDCKVVPEILETTSDITCTYRDIIYDSDAKYHLGANVDVKGADVYKLTQSDHAKVKCTGKHENTLLPSKWTGHVAGFRSTITPKTPPKGREDTLNVLIFGFDSTSRNGFIRKMPNSYRYLMEDLQATVLKGYNIVGDGTPAALFPILTGKTELELPDVRKKMNTGTLDDMPFIFYKLKEDGYRTAYFEDMPWIGTFQYRFNGFKKQPADHYLRSFYLEESSRGSLWSSKDTRYCVGATPRYQLMMNLTDQFLRLDGKRFGFTFIADITHDDFNVIGSADNATVEFFRTFKDSGRMKDTLLIVMGDHGARYANVRSTLQGKLEERLPLMALVLPEELKKKRPNAQANLEKNANVLTTPHDIHATVLDVLNWTNLWNDYRIRGADLPRALTLLEPVPKNRSCSEAGIEPHWCACLTWQDVSENDPIYKRVVDALVRYINQLTQEYRSLCVPRTLTSVGWVMKQLANNHLISFVSAKDADGYVGKFGGKVNIDREVYQVKIVVGPGVGVYEASLTYSKKADKFDVNYRDISRTNAYNDEPHCISASHPHLNMYCYCND